jgi:F0F1-type ATP synthase membrane subunit c/vacuolar-type H+-ATPase subunit K
MLRPEQRAELEQWGAATVRAHLGGFALGAGADIAGFKSGNITRSDITDWLAEKSKKEESKQAAVLLWAKIAAIASIIGVVVGIVAIFAQK